MQIEQKQNRVYKPQGVYTLSAEESNQITTELENLITEGGLTPNANVLTQVKDSVNNIVDTAANDLQSQIDAITAASDVFDVVGTYAQLQAYDTSTVPVNDIIKVLQDETRQNAMTYYRWNGTTWVFIGAEGPYYTVAETDTKFALKTQLPGIATTAQAGIVKPDNQTIIVQSDGTLSATTSILAALPLFTCQFSDHLINNASYLRADTFSWHSGSVYSSAYQHLVDDIAGKTAETETISGITITFYRATDGHKIVLASEETNIADLYDATGVAWYYVLDTANTRFKLPRTKYNVVGLRDNVGNYVVESLPNITGTGVFAGVTNTNPGTGAFTKQTSGFAIAGTSTGTYNKPFFDASDASSAYQDNAPVQQRATQMYLYFYVGNTVQSQTTIDVGMITEALNGKVDLPTGRTQTSIGLLVESYVNGTSWYRVYSDGWCEQGGRITSGGGDANQNVTFLRPFANTDYYINLTSNSTNNTFNQAQPNYVNARTTTGFTAHIDAWNPTSTDWEAKGYIS